MNRKGCFAFGFSFYDAMLSLLFETDIYLKISWHPVLEPTSHKIFTNIAFEFIANNVFFIETELSHGII